MNVTFEMLRPSLASHDPDGVRELLRHATPQERAALVSPLTGYVAAARKAHRRVLQDGLPALCVAAAGCMPTASQLTSFLTRREFRRSWEERSADLVLAALRDRGVSWLPELVERLSGQLDTTARDQPRWKFVAALARGGYVPVPTTDVFVRHWVRARRLPASNRVVDNLRRDPWLIQLAPRVLDADGWGGDLLPAAGSGDAAQQSVAGSLALLSDEGLLDRTTLLDGCLGQFLRGGRQSHLRGFVALYRALAPTPSEVATRVADHLRLLPDAYSVVAGIAQAALRAADEAGSLGPGVAVEAGHAVLQRTDKKLFRDQVKWLDAVAQRDPGRIDDVVRALAVGFGNAAADLAERALGAALRHLGNVGDDTRVLLADAAARLPPQLRHEAGALRPRDPVAAVPVLAPTIPAVTPFPDPIASPAELAEEMSALWRDPADPVRLERVLAGVVTFSHDDRDKLATALTSAVPGLQDYGPHRSSPLCLHGYLGAMLRQVVGAPQRERTEQPPADLRELPGPHRVLVLRIAEIAACLDRRPVPTLVATPTTRTGQLAAGVLVARVAAAERAGWEPWPSDLAQALLRLPCEVDGDAVTRAQRLTSPAGRRLAERLAAGPPPAVMSERRVLRRRPREDGGTLTPSERALPSLRVQVQLVAPPDADLAVTQLADLSFGAWLPPFAPRWSGDLALWPMVAPSHREAVAAWALQHLARLADEDEAGGSAILPLLAETTGQVGPALTAALAYVLGARHARDRGAATKALMGLVAAGDLPTDALGAELGHLMAAGVVKVNRVVSALADASRACAAPYVWGILAACLPAVLAADPVPRHAADLLVLAAGTASVSAPAAEWLDVPELKRVAARPGRGRLVTEARRLEGLLRSRGS